ncbi:MAG TPA: hypothetical protein VEZ89_17020, partial [Rubrivivax sp.]|nr:hypothetical protein [Rubrivivax sp.]
SRILGSALLATRAPMYARTGALVSNLAVQFKRGRSSSLVWVTTLDRGRPVPAASVAVNDCNGQPLWNGSTAADGTALINRGFANADDSGAKCVAQARGIAASNRGGSTSPWPAASRPTAVPIRCSTARCCAPVKRCR